MLRIILLFLTILIPRLLHSGNKASFKTIYYIEFVYRNEADSLEYGRVFTDIENIRDRILMDNFYNWGPCGGAYRFKDSLLSIFKRNRCILPLHGYEIANISSNQNNAYFNTFGTKDLPERSRLFYTTICHQQTAFWCNNPEDLDSTHDIIFSVHKLKVKGILYSLNLEAYKNHYFKYKVSYNAPYNTNSVFFAKGTKDIRKALLYIPSAFYQQGIVPVIFVTRARYKKTLRVKAIYKKPDNY